MTAEEIVLGGYASYMEGDMEALGSIYHPECKITMNGNHALSGVYIGFDAFHKGILAKLNTAWPGFKPEIEKVVSNETDVVVFLKITAMNLESRSVHHFVVKEGLQVEFNIYDDSQLAAEAIQIKGN